MEKTRRGYLERFDEGPEKSADALAAVEQLDESHDAKQTEEVDLDDGRAVELRQRTQRRRRICSSARRRASTLSLAVARCCSGKFL